MPRKRNPWFRFYVEAVYDRKLRRQEPAHRWLWVAMLAVARESPEPGTLLLSDADPETGPVHVDDLADVAALDRDVVERGIKEFERLGMIEVVDGTMRISNWGARQFESDDVTSRTRKHRRKERSNDVPGNGPRDRDRDREKKTPSSSKGTIDADGYYVCRGNRSCRCGLPAIKDLHRDIAKLIAANGWTPPDKHTKANHDWRAEVDKMLRIDQHDPPEIRAVAKWATDDEFWRGNIRSPGKLRQHFDQLQIRMNGRVNARDVSDFGDGTIERVQ